MVAIAAIAMTVAYPGKYFPEISSRYAKRVAFQNRVEEEIHESGHKEGYTEA